MVIHNGIVDGYYYVDGVKTAAGLLFIDGNYYYAEAGGKLKANGSYWISRNLYGMLTEGTYLFDAEGKIVMDPCINNENGDLYYYKDGKRVDNAGLVYVDGNYYLISSGAKVICGETRWVNRTNGLMPAGEYTFGADGRMVL